LIFGITDQSCGYIDSYNNNTDSLGRPMTKLMIKKDDIWLTSRMSGSILHLNDNFIVRYNNCNLPDSVLSVKFLDFDECENMWLVLEMVRPIHTDLIYFGNINNLVKYENKTPNNLINLFFVSNMYKYFISDNILTVINSKNEEKLIMLNAKEHIINYNYYLNDSSVFLLDTKWNFYEINKDKKLNHSILRIHEKPAYNFGFIIKESIMYITGLNGIIVYDLSNDEYTIIKPTDFEKHCTLGFEDIKLFGNEIAAIYGNGEKNNCRPHKYGLSLMEISR
jgi:hypothetical protein